MKQRLARFFPKAALRFLPLFFCFLPFAQPVAAQCTSDSLALVALYNSTNGAGWANDFNWLTANPIGTWYGVKTDPGSGCVTRLLLSTNNLQGTLPTEIGNFTEMDTMILSFNAGLTGSIPASISGMPSIQALSFGNCNLSGSIPSSIGSMTSLTNLGLHNNNLSGTIPPELGNLSNCTDFYLHENNLTGQIPAALSGLTSAQWFWLHNNNLLGCIPPEIHGLCPHVVSGNISGNPLLATQSWANFCMNHEGECCYLPLTATLSGTNTICNGNNTALTFNFTNGTGPYDVVWSEGILNDILNGHVVSVSPTVTTTYTLSSVTDANGCTGTSTSSVTITVNDVVTLGSVSGMTEVCSGDLRTYSVTPLAGVSAYTWTVPAGAVITNGQGSPTISVVWGTTSGNVCVKAVNTCGLGPESCLFVTVTPAPAQPGSITGATTSCNNSTEVYSIDAVPGADTYTWTWPANAIPISGQGTTTFTLQWTGTGTGDVCVKATNVCGNHSPPRCLSVTTSNALTPPTFTSGDFTPCQNSSSTYSVNTQTGATSYQWTAPVGATITGNGNSTVTIAWGANAQSGDLCVVVTSAACGTSSACQAINVEPFPAEPDPITGDATVCVGIPETYSIPPVSGATSYGWNVPAGASIQSGQGTTTVSILWNTATTGNVCARAQNACGNSIYRCYSVTSVATPVQPGAINGLSNTCMGSPSNYSIAAVSGATNYTWTAANGNITAGQGTTSITVEWSNTGMGNVCVEASNLCGTSAPRCLSVTTAATPVPPVFDANNNISPCQNSSHTYSVEAQVGITNYQWTAPAGATISGNGNSTVTITWGGTTSGDLCVTATSATCGTASACQAITVGAAPAQPGPITGSSNTCVGNSSDYSIAAVNGADTYTWTATNGTAGQGSITTTVNWAGAGAGNVCVTATNTTCNTTSPPSCLAVTTIDPPTQPNFTAGNFMPCQNSTNSAYSVNPQTSVSSYLWTLPPGANIVSGQGTASIIINWNGASSGQLCVFAASNICNITVSTCQDVEVVPTPTQPEPISGPMNVCAGAELAYTIAEVLGATNYTWTVPTNATITNGQGTFTATIQWNTADVGNVCVTASNTTCNTTSPPRCLSVTTVAPPTPPTFASGNNLSPCENTTSSYSVNTQASVNDYQWTYDNGGSISGQGNATVSINWAGATPGQLCVVATSDICSTSESNCQNINVIPIPVQPDPIDGLSDVCVGAEPIYTIAAVPGATNYTWTVPANATLLSGQNTTTATIRWNTAGVGNVCVTASNTCATSPPRCLSVTAVAPPVPPTFTSGNNISPCENTTSSYSVNTQASVNNYNWTLPPGANIVSGQGTSTVTIDWNGASSGDLCVDAISAICGTLESSCQAITVRIVPQAPGSITGDEEVCVGASVEYSIESVTGATSYNWIVPAGATLLSGQNSTTATIRWNTASTGKIRVRAQNTCGNSAYTELSVTSYAVPTMPVFLAGNFAPCENTTPNYGVIPQPAFQDYQWMYSSGGNITIGQGTANITMDWLGANDGELCVVATSAVCNVDRSACKSVVIKPLPAMPEYDSADDVLCVGDTGVYVLNPVPGAISYTWTASGGVFIGNPTGSTVKIKWPVATFTTMEVSATNGCGTGPINYSPTVLVGQPPAQPGTITGLTTVCQGSLQLYSIAPVSGAESYTWTVPAGAVIQGGQGTTSVSIKFDTLGGSSVCVRANALFCESPIRCLNVAVGASVGNPGPVDGPSVVCQNSVAVYSVAPVLGATGYLWTLPPGGTFVGGNNTASVTINFAAAASGQVCVSALSACGASAASCQAVAVGTFLAPNISGATSFCTGDSTLLDAGAGYTTYAWAGPNGFSANSQRPTVNIPGTYTVTVSAGGCTGTASVTVSVGTSLSPTIVGSAAVCTGGATTLLAGSGYTSYAWSGPLGFTASTQQVSVSATGVYTVSVSNASGCTGAGTYTLASYALPMPTIVGPSSVCVGDTAVLDAGAGYTAYAWSNATTLRTLSATSVGAYTVTVTDGNGCTGTDNHTVIVNGLAPPSCQSTLTLPLPNSTSVPTTTNLQWKPTPGCVDGYHLSLGTTPGGSDLLNNQVVADTFYQPAPPLPPGLLVYVRVVPFNVQGEAAGCAEFSFKTAEVSACDAAGDSLELVKLHTATNGPGWANLWDLAKPVSTWYGVTVAAGCVTAIDLSANKLSGSLPDLNLPGLQIFECDRNDLDGTIPSFVYAPKLKQFKCYDNQFTFEDLLPSYAALQSKLNILNYNTQDSVFHDTLLIRNIGENLDFDLDFDNSISSNLYRWHQDGTPQPTYDQSGNNNLIIPNLNLSHVGVWRVQVTNTLVPDLTLYSRGIRLQINCVADAAITAPKTALCPNESVLLSAAPQQVGNTYAWYRNGSPLPGGNGSTFSAAQVGDYQVLVKNAAGCDSLSPVLSLSLAPSVVPSISSLADGTVLGCTKTELTLAAIGGDTYSWAGPGGFTANGQQSTASSPGTYTLTATDAGTGCTGTATVEITQDVALPIVAATGNVLTCKTTEVTLTGYSNTADAIYTWTGPNGYTASGQQPTASSPGTYTLIGRDPANGCTNTATASVIQQISPPGATASASGTISCTQLTSNLQGNSPAPGATYAWAGPNGYTANSQQPTASSPGTYTLTTTGPNGCTSTATVEVTGSSDVPIASATGGAVDCDKASDTLSVTSSISGSTYLWAGPGGFTANSQQPTATEPGTYTVVVTATPGCTATATAVLEDKRQTPDVAAAGGNLPCSPQEVVLQGASATPSVTYSWAGPNSFTASSQQPTVNSPGTYTLTVRNTDTGCTATATASVTSNSIFPSASIATPNGLTINCLQPALVLEAPSGTSSIDYAWTKPDGTAANGQQQTANSPGTYTLTATDTNTGCTATSTTTVFKNTSPPDISAAGGTLTCVLDSVVLVGTSATPGAAYIWTGPNGYTATGQQPTTSSPGTYTLKVTDPANGCTATSTATVLKNTNPPLSISAAGGTLTCVLDSVALTGNAATPGATYAWVGPNGYTASSQQPIANSPGTYTLTVTDPANGCTATSTASIFLDKTPPVAGIVPLNAPISCAAPSVQLQGTGGNTYAWTGPGGNPIIGQQPTVSNTGIYTVTVTAANGCTATATATVLGDVAPPPASISTLLGTEINCFLPNGVSLKAAGGNSPIWSGPNGFVDNTLQVIAQKLGIYTVTVTGDNGCTGTATVNISENKTPPMVSATGGRLECGVEPFRTVLQANVGANGANFEWVGPGAGPNSEKYTGSDPTVYKAGVYTVTATDKGNGCTATQQVVVDSVLVLSPTIAYSGKAICAGGATVGLKASGGFVDYEWSNGQITDSITVNSPGAYVVTVTDAAKCVGTASVTVLPAQVPMPIISGKLAFCPGEKIQLAADLTFNGYQWSNGAGSPAIEVNKAGIYTVTVTNMEGCTGTSSVEVTQLPGPTAMLTVPQDSICPGSSVTFTASGGQQYQFWVNGVAQGPFSANPQLTLSNVLQAVTVSVRVVSGNTCQDSTVADFGPGRSPIEIVVLPLPSLSTAFVTHIPTCPEDSVQVLVSLNGLPNGTYDLSWQLDGGATKTAPVFFFNKLGTLMLPPLPPGQHTCTMLGAGLPGTGCPTAWPSNGGILTFNILAPIVTALDTTICYTQSVDFCGKSYTQSGIYTCALKTTAGCDSTVVLQLQSVKEFEKELKVTICKGSTYDFYGQILTDAGYYQHALSGTLGCDSLFKLTLIEEVPSINQIDKTICPGASYAVGDSVFSRPGKYEVRLKSLTSDCDSIIQLDLKWVENPPAVDFPEDTLRRCGAVTTFLSPTVQNCSNCKYKWTGGATLTGIFVSPTASTVYTVTVTNATSTCTASAAVTVLVVPPYTVVADTLLCLGEQLFGKVVLRDTSITIQEECSTLTLNVEVANDPPFTAQQDELTLPLNSTASTVFNVAAELLANDQPQPIGNDRVLSIVRGPRLGTAVLSADGSSLRYTPLPGGVVGLDSLRYSICPPSGCPAGCDSAWVILRAQKGDLQWVEDNMPNLITPGEVDGENDVFDPLDFLKMQGGIVPDEGSVRLYIFNRWGEVVYRPYPYKRWEGLHGRGDGERPLPQATYYYLLQFKIGGKQEQIRGPVNLLK